jgi:gliding motility-associated-like protein
MYYRFFLFFCIFFSFFGEIVTAQVVSPFNIRYQTNQKGGIVILSNVSLTCNGNNPNCGTFQQQVPPAGNHNQDGNIVMGFVDVDAVTSTYNSSSDSLNLNNCSEILWAGLYWSARVTETTTNYVSRNTVRIRTNNDSYQTLTADQTLDVPSIASNSNFQMPSYFCFKDVTGIVQAGGNKARYTIANVVSQTGVNNLFGAWSLVVVYKNVFQSMRNLTVFDGMAYVSSGNSVDLPISGFVTPQLGPVSFELGVVAYEGDRNIQGDKLQFNGNGSFIDIVDPLRSSNDFFNSTCTSNGAFTPFRNPNYKNNLGLDCGIFNPNNTGFNYIGNNATNATIKVVTSQDAILPRVITSAIDILEPDLRANVRINDLNGGLTNPGDILEYTLVGKNIGSDISLETYMVDTLDARTTYIPGSISIVHGPNQGAKTDFAGDDQAEFNSLDNTIKVRIGTGANSTIGGQVNNSSTGADSTVIKFRVVVVDDCLLFQCDNNLSNKAYIFGKGNISQNFYNNDGVTDILDANGCPSTASNTLAINVSSCPTPILNSNGPVCPGSTLNLFSQFSENVTYNWIGPNGFTSDLQNPSIPNVTSANAGTYTINYTFPGLSCLIDTSITVTIYSAPIIQSSSFVNPSCFGSSNGSASVIVSGTGPFTYLWSNGATTSSISNLVAGNYTVTVTNSTNCTTIQNFTLTQPLILGASASVTSNYNGFNVSCINSTNGSAIVATTGGTSPYSVLWSNGATTQNLINIGAGIYTVTITDSKSCTTNSSVTLTQPTALQLGAVNQTNVSCFGGNNGALDITVSGSVPAYSYAWSNSATTQDISNLTIGTYTITITDANNCTTNNSYTITQPSAALSSTLTSTNILCFGNSTGSIDLTIAGGTSPYSYLWSNGATIQDLSNLPSGAYSVTVADSKGCQLNQSIILTQPSGELLTAISGTNVSCLGGANGSLDLIVNGGTAGYTYLWSNGATTQDISNLSFGNYSVTVTDANACNTNSIISITQPPTSIQFSASLTQISCFNAANGAINLTPQGGTAPFIYTWSNGATTATINSLSPGSYTINAVDANSCPFTNQYTIIEPQILAATSSSVNVNCFGASTGSINLTVTGGTSPYTFSWSNGATIEDLSSLSAGNYTVAIQDANGCSTSLTVTISQTPTPVSLALTGTNLSCFENSTGSIQSTVSGGVGPYSYNWSNGETTASISSLTIGTYTLTVNDNLGCSSSSTTTITQPTSLQLSAQNTAIKCFGENTGTIDISVIGGTIPYTYSWSNGETTQDLNNVGAGNYQLILTDNNGCSLTTNYTLTEPNAALSTTNSITNVSCFGGANGTISVTTTGGTSPYSYAWNTGTTTEDLTGLSFGTYTLTITDANNCSTNLSATVNQPTPLSENAVVQNILCHNGNSGSINSTITGGTTPYSSNWSNGSTSEDLSNLANGTYSVIVTDANNCSVSNTYNVTQPLQPIQNQSTITNVLCIGESNGSINLSVNGGTSPYNYVWSNSALTEDISGLSIGTYTVTITDANNCITTFSETINEPVSGIQISSIPTSVACFGDATGAINLNANGGTGFYTFLWSNGETTQNLQNLFSGSYSVLITDENNCTANSTIFVSQPTTPLTISESHQDALCVSSVTGSIDLTVSGGNSNYSYVWSNGQTSQDISSLSEGIYTVTVTDGQLCQENISVQILDPNNLIILTETHSDVTCFGATDGSIDLTITGGNAVVSYNWSNGAATEDLNNLSAGNYFVNVIDINGCNTFLATTVSQPIAPLSVTATVSNVVCFGQTTGSFNLNPVGGTAPYSFIWSTGATTEDIGNLSAGNYSVVITDFNGCSIAYNGTINQASSLISTTSNQINVSCFAGSNGAINVAVSGGISPYTYTWNTGATSQDLNNLSAGSYSVNIQDNNGCTVQENFVITQPTSGVQGVLVSQNVSCRNGANGAIQLTVSGGSPNYTYNWNNGATTEDLNNLTAGQFAVLITDANGCTNSYTAQITQPSTSLIATIQGTSVLCHNGASGVAQVNVSGGNTPYNYTWNNGESITTIDSLVAGNYSVVITDNNGCSVSSSIQINQPPALIVNTQNNNVICYGQSSGIISSNVTGGINPYTYLWSNGATTTGIQNLAAGPYFLNITDANGCTTTFSDTIYQPTNSIALNANVTANICFGEDEGSIDLTTTGGTAPYQYLWNNTATTEDLTQLLAGTYTVTILDANNCLFTQNIAVGQPSTGLSTNALISNVLCNGGNTGGVNLQVSGPSAPFSYLWSNAATTQDISNLTAGIYNVTVSNSVGCSVSASFNVTEQSSPLTYGANITNVTCFGGNNGGIDISVFGGTAPYQYLWSNGLGTQDLNNQLQGNYSVTITDANGCELTQNETISEPSSPIVATLNPTAVNCFGQSTGTIDLTVSGGTPIYTYLWSNGNNSQDLVNVPSGIYNVVITDAQNCNLQINTTITQPASAISVNAIQQNINCSGEATGNIQLTTTGATPNYTYLWNTGETTSTISNLTAGVYNVTVQDALGCFSNLTYQLTQSIAPITVTNNLTNVSCFNGINGAINLQVGGGTTPYSYTWSNSATSNNLINVIAGNYSVTITDSRNCSVVENYVLTQPSAIVINTNRSNVSCFAGNNGFIDATISGGTAPFNFLWNNGATTEDVANLIAGNYNLTVNDANGCSASLVSTINQPIFATTLSAAVVASTCNNEPLGSIDLTVNSANLGFVYSWNNGATTEDIQFINAGTYTVTVVDNNNCVTNNSFVVGQVTAISANPIITPVNCFDGNDGSINLNVSGGTAPYTYSWTTGETTEDILNLAAGNYFVTITDGNNCNQNATFNVSQPTDSLQVSANVTNTICNNFSDGNILLQVSGGTGPYNYNWNNGSVSEDLINIPANIYSTIITDENGCSINRTFLVTEPQPLAATFGNTEVSCFGNSNGFINLDITGGTGDYVYLWSNGETTQDLVSITANSYSVVVTDSNGCVLNASTIITQPANSIGLQLSAINSTCFGSSDGSIDLTIQGGTSPYTINWNNGQITEDISGIPSGFYRVIVSDSNSCSISDSINVLQPIAPLSITGSVVNISCFNGSNGLIDITVAGGTFPYTYNWSNGINSQDNLNITSGSYTVTVTDDNNCQIQSSFTVSQPASGMALSGNTQNVTCANGNNGAINLIVNGGSSPYNYTWSNAATTEDLSAIQAGVYIVNVTDASNCTISDTFTINQPLIPISITISTSNISCFDGNNGSIDISTIGGTPGYSFNWNNFQITEDLNNLFAGTYTFQVSDQLGCTLDTVITLTQPSQITLIVSQANILCHGNNTGFIDLQASGGTPNYTYEWSNGATTEDISSLVSGTYNVITTDANSCQQTTNVIITQPATPLSVTEIHQDIICFGGNNGSIDLTVTGGTAPYLYTWSNGLNAQDLANLVAGNYTVNVQDANGCSQLLTISIDQPAAQTTLSANIDKVECFGNASGSIDLTVVGGTSPYTYSWNNGTYLTQDVFNVVSGVYSVVVTDANNCVISSSYTITQPASALNAVSNSTPVTCFEGTNGTVSVAANGGTVPYTYLWNNGVTSTTQNGLSAGSYSVQVTDANGCVFNSVVDVIQPEPLIADFTLNSLTGCSPLTVDFTNTSQGSPTSCFWDFGNGQSSTDCNLTNYTYTNPGCYSISLTLNSGANCSSIMEIDSAVCVLANPSAAFNFTTASDVFYSGEVAFNNLSIGGSTYVWSFGDNSPNSIFENPDHEYPNQIDTSYYVTLIVTDSNGCVDTVVNIVTIDSEFFVYVPNTITVDGNSYNEVFFPVFADPNRIKKYKLTIYNRWGQNIWETTDLNQGWDGRAFGKDVQEGIYTWKIDYELYFDGNRKLVGHVTLLR